MLVTLGARRASVDLVDQLLECHHRIRRFLALAGELASRPALDDTEVQVTAEQVRRYFAEALPLHVEDEDETITATLASASPVVVAALAQMTREHVEMEPAIDRLIGVCAELVREPQRRATLALGLAALSAELETRFATHLALEEGIIFPALRALPDQQREHIRVAMQRRRVG